MSNNLNLFEQIRMYFENLKEKDEDHMAFDMHHLSSVDNLLDPTKPAPWHHLTNSDDDDDVDVDIQEEISK